MKLLIVGLGHLAKRIVKLNNSFDIWGTYRDLNKVSDLSCHKILFKDSGFDYSVFNIVIFNLPPVESYKEILDFYISKFSQGTIIYFVSSTSVFGDGEISEESQKVATTKNSELLISLESYLLSQNFDLNIIRPAGLIDESRNPAKFLSKKSVVEQCKRPINLVHTNDVASFILLCIKKDIVNDNFNLVYNFHPSKKEFYSSEMKRLKLKEPQWNDTPFDNKIISNLKSKSIGFDYIYSKEILCLAY